MHAPPPDKTQSIQDKLTELSSERSRYGLSRDDLNMKTLELSEKHKNISQGLHKAAEAVYNIYGLIESEKLRGSIRIHDHKEFKSTNTLPSVKARADYRQRLAEKLAAQAPTVAPEQTPGATPIPEVATPTSPGAGSGSGASGG